MEISNVCWYWHHCNGSRNLACVAIQYIMRFSCIYILKHVSRITICSTATVLSKWRCVNCNRDSERCWQTVIEPCQHFSDWELDGVCWHDMCGDWVGECWRPTLMIISMWLCSRNDKQLKYISGWKDVLPRRREKHKSTLKFLSYTCCSTLSILISLYSSCHYHLRKIFEILFSVDVHLRK